MRKYRIISPVRFTIFLAAVIIITITAFGTLLGFNNINSAAKDQYTCVEISSGDTLWEIAKEYGPSNSNLRNTVNDICQLNNITAGQIQPGQTILVPVYN